jgi:hypothetical protein
MVDREAILEELIQYNRRPRLREDEILVEQYVEAWNADPERNGPMDQKRGRKDLDRMVRDGMMTKRKVFHEGRWMNAYSYKEGESDISG